MKTVNAKIVDYNDSGKTLKAVPIKVNLCTGDKRRPVAEITLKDRGRVMRSIHIPFRQLYRQVCAAMEEMEC